MAGERFAKHSKGIALGSFAHKDKGQLKQLAFVFLHAIFLLLVSPQLGRGRKVEHFAPLLYMFFNIIFDIILKKT